MSVQKQTHKMIYNGELLKIIECAIPPTENDYQVLEHFIKNGYTIKAIQKTPGRNIPQYVLEKKI